MELAAIVHSCTFTHLNGHQIVAHRKWSTIGPSSSLNEIVKPNRRDIGRTQADHVRVHGELRPHRVEDHASLFRCRVVIANGGERLVLLVQPVVTDQDFMDQHIHASARFNDAFIERRVAADQHRSALVVHTITKSRLDQFAVIDGKRGDVPLTVEN